MPEGRGARAPHRVRFSEDMFDVPRPPEVLAALVLDAGPAKLAGGRHEDLGEHLAMLAREFSGQSLLAFRHAWLTVLIRRGMDLDAALAEFRALWDDHAALLDTALDLRWLISAADTLMLHPRDEGERMAALAATLAGNIVKMAETERLSLGIAEGPRPGPTVEDHLLDGLRAFKVGSGDMLHNLLSRIGASDRTGGGHAVLGAVIGRLVAGDSVIRRMTLTHTKPKFRPAFRERTVALFPGMSRDPDPGGMGVMAALDGMIASRGSRVIFRHRAGGDWRGDPGAREAIASADLVLAICDGVTGPPADLSALGPACREAGTRAVLLNAAWGGGDEAALTAIAGFDAVWVTESESAAALARRGIAARICADLTLSLPERAPARRRAGQLFWDSFPASPPVPARWAAMQRQPLLLMRRDAVGGRILGHPARHLRRAGEGALPPPRALMRCSGFDDVRAIIAGATGITTGSFHALCCAILDRTPFLAVPSDRGGIEAMLADTGLGGSRLAGPGEDWRPPPPFDEGEMGAIELYLQRARAARDRMAYDLLG